jgi:hypothetical protein
VALGTASSGTTGCGNLVSNVNVPVIDGGGADFITISGDAVTDQFKFTNLDALDVDTTGLISLLVARVAVNGTAQYSGRNYTLESPALRRSGGVIATEISGNFPTGLQVSLSGAEDLANGKFSINAPAFTFPGNDIPLATFGIYKLLLVRQAA